MKYFFFIAFPECYLSIFYFLGGSRAGGIVAACWAAMITHGKQGYIDTTKAIIDTTRYIEKGVREIGGIHIIGVPEVCVISIGSDNFNIYGLSDDY